MAAAVAAQLPVAAGWHSSSVGSVHRRIVQKGQAGRYTDPGPFLNNVSSQLKVPLSQAPPLLAQPPHFPHPVSLSRVTTSSDSACPRPSAPPSDAPHFDLDRRIFSRYLDPKTVEALPRNTKRPFLFSCSKPELASTGADRRVLGQERQRGARAVAAEGRGARPSGYESNELKEELEKLMAVAIDEAVSLDFGADVTEAVWLQKEVNGKKEHQLILHLSGEPTKRPPYPAPNAPPPQAPAPAQPYDIIPLPMPWHHPWDPPPYWQAWLVWDQQHGRNVHDYINDMTNGAGWELLAVYQGPGGLLQANHHFVLFYDPDTNDIVPVYYQMGQGRASFEDTDLLQCSMFHHALASGTSSLARQCQQLAQSAGFSLEAFISRAGSLIRRQRVVIGKTVLNAAAIPYKVKARKKMPRTELLLIDAARKELLEVASLVDDAEALAAPTPIFNYTRQYLANSPTGNNTVPRKLAQRAQQIPGLNDKPKPIKRFGGAPHFDADGRELSEEEVWHRATGYLMSMRSSASERIRVPKARKAVLAALSDTQTCIGMIVRKFEQQQGKCAISGQPLNWADRGGAFQASISHKQSTRRRFPGFVDATTSAEEDLEEEEEVDSCEEEGYYDEEEYDDEEEPIDGAALAWDWDFEALGVNFLRANYDDHVMEDVLESAMVSSSLYHEFLRLCDRLDALPSNYTPLASNIPQGYFRRDDLQTATSPLDDWLAGVDIAMDVLERSA